MAEAAEATEAEINPEINTVPIPDYVERQAQEAERLFEENAKQDTIEADADKDKAEESTADANIQEDKKEAEATDFEAKLAAIQHKYDVLQGKYNAEVPRLNKSLADAKQLIDSQKEKLEDLAKAPQAQELRPLDIAQLKDIGLEDEIIQMAVTVNQLAANQKNNNTQTLAEKVDKHEDYIKSTATAAAEASESSFFKAIGENVKDWEAVNDDPVFLNWLSENDLFSGVSRRDLLVNAQNRLDSNTAINIFKAFKDRDGNSSNKKPKRKLSDEVIPSSTVGSDNTAPKKNSITQADVAKASGDFARGRISEVEFNKIANEFQKTL